MTMRVMGIRGELTGRCSGVHDKGFTMDVDGEDFGADVTWWRADSGRIQPGALLFVVGRISFRDFAAESRHVLVQAERVDLLDPPGERRPASGKVPLPMSEPTVEEMATAPPEFSEPPTQRLHVPR
jgi:hypothetical protein